MILFLIGSMMNLGVVWSARRWQIVLLWLLYHAMLAVAFIRPALITPGIGYWRGYLVPGPTVVSMLALLAIEAGAMAAVRLDGITDRPSLAATRLAIAMFGIFVFECLAAIGLMAIFEIGLY